MKANSFFKPIIALFLMTILLNVPAQSLKHLEATNAELFEWTQMPTLSSLINSSISTLAGEWIVAGALWNSSSSLLPPVVVKLTASGEPLWQYPQGSFEWEMGSSDVITHSYDGNLFVSGWCMMGCDYGPAGTFLHKISQEGQVIWKKIFITENYTSAVSDIIESTTGYIYVLQGKHMLKVSSAGDSLGTSYYPMLDQDEFSSGLATNDFLLLGHPTGIIKTDLDGNIISTHDFNGPVRNLTKNDNGFIFISGNQLVKTDAELNVIQTYDFSGIITGDFNSVVNNDEFIIVGNNHILQIGFDLQVIADNNFEIPENFKVTTIASNNNLILMSGNNDGSSMDFAMAAKTYMLDGTSLNVGIDAGIVNLRAENVQAIRYPNYPGVYDFEWDAFVTVKNFGSEIINAANLVSRLVAYGICSDWYYIIPENNMSLYPGDSVEIPLGQIKDFGLYYPNQTSAYYTWKMHTMNPNGLIDRSAVNDEASIALIIDLTVGIDENPASEIKIFPNPASDLISIEMSGSGGFGWNIKSITGQTLASGFSESRDTKAVVGTFPTGLYFIEILKDERRIHVEKLLISQ